MRASRGVQFAVAVRVCLAAMRHSRRLGPPRPTKDLLHRGRKSAESAVASDRQLCRRRKERDPINQTVNRRFERRTFLGLERHGVRLATIESLQDSRLSMILLFVRSRAESSREHSKRVRAVGEQSLRGTRG